MDPNYLIALITVVVSLIAGEITKRYPNINKKKVIPLQNLTIGVIVAIANYTITRDFNGAIATSGLLAGGIYDLVSNLRKIKGGE